MTTHMKRRARCPVCGYGGTLNKRGEIPTHFEYGGFQKAVECMGSRKVVTND